MNESTYQFQRNLDFSITDNKFADNRNTTFQGEMYGIDKTIQKRGMYIV